MKLLQEHTGLTNVDKYIRTAVWNDRRKYGRFAGCCCQGPCKDVVQQVYKNVCESHSKDYLYQIADVLNTQPSRFKETPEYAVLARAIAAAIGQFRWAHNKR